MLTIEELLQELSKRYEKLKLGGGLKKIEAHKAKGKLTARERIEYLIDKDKNFIEFGTFAGEGMYAEDGGCPNGGCVCVIAYVSGKMCIVVIYLSKVIFEIGCLSITSAPLLRVALSKSSSRGGLIPTTSRRIDDNLLIALSFDCIAN